MTTIDTLLTLDDYFDLPERPGVDVEMLDGKVVEMAKPSFEHNEMMIRCAHVLTVLCKSRFPNLRVSGDTEFVLNAGTVQAPDVVLLDQPAFETAGRYRGALQCAPALAVEIVSPHDTSAHVDDKVGNYLEAGAKTVWVLWPRRRHALAYHRDGSVQHVVAGQFLEAPEVLPGARIPLDEILLPAHYPTPSA
ncbi:MAG: Uma2 family endonuclease [Bryobacteraceae bacterium]